MNDQQNEQVVFDLLIDGAKKQKEYPQLYSKWMRTTNTDKPWENLYYNGCIKTKKKKPPALMEFNQIFDRISLKDKIGHLFIVDMKFHNKNPKTLLFHEIYPPVFEENKKMNP